MVGHPFSPKLPAESLADSLAAARGSGLDGNISRVAPIRLPLSGSAAGTAEEYSTPQPLALASPPYRFPAALYPAARARRLLPPGPWALAPVHAESGRGGQDTTGDHWAFFISRPAGFRQT